MSVNLSPVAGAAAQFLDNSGNVLTGGKLYTYLAGTTTPAATYTSSTGLTFHSNPIILDAAGRVPAGGEIWLSDNVSYKFVLKDANDVLIATWDNLTGINSNFVNYTSQEEIIVATAGQTVFNLTTVTYVPGTNSLQVFVDGVNQYDGITYAYVETDATTVTFTAGLHVGALVKFTTAVSVSAGSTNANLVIYNEGDIGAVDRTVESKLQETVSVKDFGAVGDGVTDDTAAIQNALDTGKNVFIPAGIYVFSAQLDLTTNGQTIYGEGHGLSVLDSSATASITALYATGIDNITIKELSLLGGESVYASAGYAGILFENCINSKVITCEISKYQYGINFKVNSEAPMVEGCIVHDCYYEGISANGITGTYTITNLRFINNTVYSIGTASYNGGAIRTEEAVGGVISNNTVYNGAGIRIENSRQCVISNNVVHDTFGTGITLYNYAKRCAVVGNVVYDCNTENYTNGATDLTPNIGNADLAGVGIELQYYGNNNVITGNNCYNSSTGNGYQQYGIAINLRNFTSAVGGGSAYNIVSNNICVGNVVSGVLDRGFFNAILNNTQTLYAE